MLASAKLFLALGAVFGACGVTLGAFGAHALKARLAADQLALWNTATQYLFWHALGLLAVGLACTQLPESTWLRTAGVLLAAGIVLFSGSLYLLALGAPRVLGAVTPIGGLAFMAGWATLTVGVLRA
ncbi:MAG: hypothetical protein AMJ64_00525 [Betaproteobacteria bacterium SG8_39]|jgi:uncharacterized membrane protein YgdD (TMEM256/DUF423 family)|nr:MAG: hypothetical protein AMJ64_00525 [Betaproteobacteria bacterium SG8_39]